MSIGEQQDVFLFVGVVASFFKVDINLTESTLAPPPPTSFQKKKMDSVCEKIKSENSLGQEDGRKSICKRQWSSVR